MKASHGMAIAGAGLVLTLPVLILGIPFLSDDAGFHAVWYTHFSHQLWAGDLYPRWLTGMNGGLGSPVFFFYPPLPYFLTSILRPFFRSDPRGLHQLGVSASLALIASGFFTYLWLKYFVDQAAALAAAILYMAMPYHLAADLYVRGSFAEYWAFVWMPLVLYSRSVFHSPISTWGQACFRGTVGWLGTAHHDAPAGHSYFLSPTLLLRSFTRPEKPKTKDAGRFVRCRDPGCGPICCLLIAGNDHSEICPAG